MEITFDHGGPVTVPRSTMTSQVQVTRDVLSLLEWPTDVFSIDHCRSPPGFIPNSEPKNTATPLKLNAPENLNLVVPHTVLVFVAGNPGIVDWYIPFFSEMIRLLGPGFAARGVANAGHSLDPNRMEVSKHKGERDTSVPWTVDGQVSHKVAYMDYIISELDQLWKTQEHAVSEDSPLFVMVSHSIGAHFTQRLCILRPDILKRIKLLIHLTPFIRMDAPQPKQAMLNFAARHPTPIIAHHAFMMKLLAILPVSAVDWLIRCGMTHDDYARDITVKLVRQPTFAENFFRLGLEEIRDNPQQFDVSWCSSVKVPVRRQLHLTQSFQTLDVRFALYWKVCPYRDAICGEGSVVTRVSYSPA